MIPCTMCDSQCMSWATGGHRRLVADAARHRRADHRQVPRLARRLRRGAGGGEAEESEAETDAAHLHGVHPFYPRPPRASSAPAGLACCCSWARSTILAAEGQDAAMPQRALRRCRHPEPRPCRSPRASAPSRPPSTPRPRSACCATPPPAPTTASSSSSAGARNRSSSTTAGSATPPTTPPRASACAPCAARPPATPIPPRSARPRCRAPPRPPASPSAPAAARSPPRRSRPTSASTPTATRSTTPSSR